MRIAVSGSKDTKNIVSQVKRAGIEIDDINPDFVITYGGDGSILWAENQYLGIPKIPVRASATAKVFMYDENDLGSILEKLKCGEYKISEVMKLEALFAGNCIVALNDFQVRCPIPVQALRFSISINGKPAFTEVIGDGAVISTPFGSGAYYSSVGGKPFKKGIGIAMNNPHDYEGMRTIVADESDEISIILLRNEGILLFDNCEKIFRISPSDEIIIRKAKENAKFVRMD
ncbi:MAG: hypothetical protein ABIF85_03345 [Nanoarchaeota archaeon]|nr:NAD(+)/NADH kinase [Nanoarchaeota archaeon]MBU4451728.1 NAD(+)/NADH kinase [Nanoarchaeota archaeon]MCG2723697.1 hypothetical protein [archaeon]